MERPEFVACGFFVPNYPNQYFTKKDWAYETLKSD